MVGTFKLAITVTALPAWVCTLVLFTGLGSPVAKASQHTDCSPLGCVPRPPKHPKPEPLPPALGKLYTESFLDQGGSARVQFGFWTLDGCNSFGVAGTFKVLHPDDSEVYPIVLADLQVISTELACPDLPAPGRYISVTSEPYELPANGARVLYPSNGNLGLDKGGQP